MTVSRTDESAECAYLLAIQGLPYLWTTDGSGTLSGTGVDSWIYDQETALGWAHARTVLPGLVLGRGIGESIDLKSMLLDTRTVSFDLIDYGGELVEIFASDGLQYDLLGEDISPGTSTLGTSIILQGGSTTNPRSRYIGLEAIGPTGQRNWYSPWPFDMIGPRHRSAGLMGPEDAPPAVPVSTTPVVHQGRIVTLWRIHRDRALSGAESWQTWSSAHDDGDQIWLGTLLDRGEIYGDKTWRIQCSGTASLLTRTLGRPGRPVTISAPLSLSVDERLCSVVYWTANASLVYTVRNSQSLTSLFGAEPSKSDIVSALQSFLQDVADGTTTDFGDGNWIDVDGSDIALHGGGTIAIRREPFDFNGLSGLSAVYIMLHEKVWRGIGYDPISQGVLEGDAAYDPGYRIPFEREPMGLPPMSLTADPADQGTVVTPIEGYWSAGFSSLQDGALLQFAPGSGLPPGSTNDGAWATHHPLTPESTTILGGDSGLIGRRINYGIDQPYIEPCPVVHRLSTSALGLDVVDSAAYFSARGIRATQADQDGTLYHQVYRCSWVSVGFGGIQGDDGFPQLFLERIGDPRRFGFAEKPLPAHHEWAATNTVEEDDDGITMTPLTCYAIGSGDGMGCAHQALLQLLLSTGTATGWSTSEDLGATFVDGQNTHVANTVPWGIDCLESSAGLAIPYQIVADPTEIRAEFDRIPGGAYGPLCTVGYAYEGFFESLDLLGCILRTRGLMVNLHGGKIGVRHIRAHGPGAAEVTIGQADLAGQRDSDLVPRQQLRAVGSLDRVKLAWHRAPDTGETLEFAARCNDAGAAQRRGDLEIELEDHGLHPTVAWQQSFRDLWTRKMPEFYSRRHFLLKLRVNRIKGQDCRVGTKIRVTNPWPVNPGGTHAISGGYGIVDASGLVIGSEMDASGAWYEVDALIFAGQSVAPRIFGPIGRVASIAGTVVTLETDHFGLDEGPDASRFAVPAWSSTTTNAAVKILRYDRKTWTLGSTYTISGVSGDEITMTGSVAESTYSDMDMYLLLAPYDDQSSTSWARAYGIPLVLDTHKFGTVPTTGWPFQG